MGVEIWLPLERWKDQRCFRLRYKVEPEPRPFLTLQPVKVSPDPEWDPRWEEWHCYLIPLTIDIQDYQQLLAGYFDRVFPTKDPIDGWPMDSLDLCSPNWLGEEDWRTILTAIRGEMGEASRRKRKFYDTFLRWLEAALTHTSIIVAEGNQ